MEIKIIILILGFILGLIVYHILINKVMLSIDEIMLLIAEEKIKLKRTDLNKIAVGVRQDDLDTIKKLNKNMYFKYIQR